MNGLLALAVLLCALPTLTEADCYTWLPNQNETHCFVEDAWHETGSQWRNANCYDCSCQGCCSAYSTPKNFPSDCVAVFNQTLCEYIVHQMGDPSVLCVIYGAVGK